MVWQRPARTTTSRTDVEDFVDDKILATGVQAHRAITEAIRAQNPEAAQRRMMRHVHGFDVAN